MLVVIIIAHKADKKHPIATVVKETVCTVDVINPI